MIKLDNILVPTDFSDYSKQALRYGSELADRFGAKVHMLHIVESPIAAMPSPGAALPDTLMMDLHNEAERRLETWPNDQISASVKTQRSVKSGAPFVEIVRYAKDEDIDLIVLGTHGRSGLRHALIGSVAERVVRKASCPVLTVRPEGHQFSMP